MWHHNLHEQSAKPASDPPLPNLAFYPTDEQTRDTQQFSQSSWTDPFHSIMHPTTISNGPIPSYIQAMPPLALFHHESIPHYPSSYVTPSEIPVRHPSSPDQISSSLLQQTARYFTPYPQGSNPDTPNIHQENFWSSAPSLTPDHYIGSRIQPVFYPEFSDWTLLDDVGPQLWTEPQPLRQQFPDIFQDPYLEFTSLQNSVAVAPSTSTLITPRGGTGPGKSCYHSPPSEGLQIPSEDKFTRSQGINPDLNPTSPGVKRARSPDTPDVHNRPSKRRNGFKGRATAVPPMNGVTSSSRSLPYQLGPQKSGAPPTIAEVHRLEPIECTQDAGQISGGDFFRNASNTVIKDSSMTAIYMRNDHPNNAALKWLRGYAMQGAEHDSADRDPPPRCHPGTRTTIIQSVQSWLGNPEREKNLLWLWGTAGVGKSAIVQTVAESLSEDGRLGASLFFSRPNGRDNPRQILPTLAYQFAIQDHSYREYITQFVLTNPESLNKAMNEQFRILIVEPFIRKGIRGGKAAWVVTLDGLDECGEDPNGRRHSNEVQRDVVRLISGFVRQYPTAPLIWVIASRPETHLKAIFSKPEVARVVWEEEVPVDSDEACEDVEKFLHKEFMKISENYPDHIRDSPWPTHAQFLKIAHTALGLSIFAEVVTRFIGDPEVGNPIAQLECVLLAISRMRSTKNPLANLDVIYLAILSKIPPSTLQITKRLLGFLKFLITKNISISSCNFSSMCQILDIPEDTALTALCHLHSVLYFPKAKAKVIGTTRPRFYHASFRDFLEDESRSHEYFIDKKTFTMNQFIPDFIHLAHVQFSSDSPLSPSSGEKCEVIPNNNISRFVQYAFSRAFSMNGFCMNEGWIPYLLPDEQVQPLLEKLSVIKLMKCVNHDIAPFKWDKRGYLKKHEPKLIRMGFLSCITFGSLGINWDTISMSTSILGEFWHVHVDTMIGIQTKPDVDDPEVEEIRHHFRSVAPNTEVKIWGHRKSGCRVVVVMGVGDPLNRKQYALTGIPSVTT